MANYREQSEWTAEQVLAYIVSKFIFMSRPWSRWWGKRVSCLRYCLQLFHEFRQKENLMVRASWKTRCIFFPLFSTNLSNLPSITTNILVSRTFSSPTDPSLRDSILNLWRMSWSTTETENFKLFWKKIFFMKILILSENFPTFKVKKPAQRLSFLVSSLRRRKKLKNLETGWK